MALVYWGRRVESSQARPLLSLSRRSAILVAVTCEKSEGQDGPSENSSKSVTGRVVVGSLLSFLFAPGIGHLLLGMNKRAIAWLVGMAVALVLTPFSFWFMLLAYLGTRIASVVDLWSCARRPRDVPKIASSFHLPIGFFILSIALLIVARNFWMEGFKIPSGAMIPTLQTGDHIMASKHDTSASRGDVVIFVNPCDPRKDFVKRVVALENDTVEVRCDQLYVNGEAVKREQSEDECSYLDLAMDQWQQHKCTLFRESLGGQSYDVIHGPEARDRIGHPGNHDFPDSHVPSCQDSFSQVQPMTTELGSLITNQAPTSNACAPKQSYKVPKGHFFVLGDNRDNSSDSRVWGAVPNSAIRAKPVYVWWARQKEGIRWSRLGLRVQ